MSGISWKNAARRLFRWYLSRFPLRDGKARVYAALHDRLLPPARCVIDRLDPGFTMELDLADPEQRKLYFYRHYHERYEARLLACCLAPGEVFWDVGAHVGYFTLLAARSVGPAGKVVAFEPSNDAWERLTRNLALNPGYVVEPVKAAVSDHAGQAVLYAAGDTVDSSASLFAGADVAARQEVVSTLTLDDFSRAPGQKPPDFIKLDVEGAELAALRGAREVLASASPLLLIEMEEKIFQRLGVNPEDLHRLLTDIHYLPAFLHKGKWYLEEALPGKPGRNIFWFRPDLPRHRAKAALIPLTGRY
jgi:FkbM family methyltransferase